VIIAPPEQEQSILNILAIHDATQGAITIGEVVAPKPGEERGW